MKKVTLLLSAIFLIFVLAACTDNSDVNTGGDGNSTEKKEDTAEAAEKEETEEESTDVVIDASSQNAEALGMKVGLGDIKIREDGISVGVNLENTADSPLNFYPDQGTLVVGDMQIDANLFLGSGDLGGEVQSGVKQDGVIEFPAPDGKTIDPSTITEVKLLFGDVTTSDFMSSEAVEITVPVE